MYGRVSAFRRNRVRRVASGEPRIKSAFAGLMDRRQLNQISITTGGGGDGGGGAASAYNLRVDSRAARPVFARRLSKPP